MSRFVLDGSVTMAWCFEDETSAAARSILDSFEADEVVVPSIWPLEVANVLVVGERRGRLAPADSKHFIALLSALPITVDDETSLHAFGDVLALARSQQLTAYDAAYLELAMRAGVPLATFDAGLRQAATRLGIALLPE